MKYAARIFLLLLTIVVLCILNNFFRALVDRSMTGSLEIQEAQINQTICSRKANWRGLGQKVIAISLFGPTENPNMFGSNQSYTFLRELIKDMQKIYSDQWILRVYHDEKYLSSSYINQMQSTYLFVDFCNVTALNLSHLPPKVWRFLPAIDPSVEIMVSRDLDSPLFPRERAAIDEWLLSNCTFHSMRDHPFHYAPMLGGMWGFQVGRDREFADQLRQKLLNQSLISKYSLNRDQQFLADHLWPYAKDKTLTHASYWCHIVEWNSHHRPFPTERFSINATHSIYIGCPRPNCFDSIFLKEPCPDQCRPKEHHHWTRC